MNEPRTPAYRWILIALAAVILGTHLIHAWHDALVPLRSDSYIYLAVGRGILNGLMPYADLFETKPPGMFLLSALSLKLFEDGRLLVLLGALLGALLPACILLAFRGRSEKRLPVVVTGLAVGALLARFSAAMAGGGITESLGATVAVIAIALWAVWEDAPWKKTLLIAPVIALAVFLKEPFLLSVLAGVLIVSRGWRSATRFAPALIAGGVVTLALLLLAGTIVDYFSTYLPHMLGFKINYSWGSAETPLSVRSINVIEIVTHLWPFSKIFTLLMGALWIGGAWILWSRDRVPGVLRWLVASWMTTLAVGFSGDYYSQHFVFAVPLFAALAILVLPAIADMQKGAMILIGTSALSLVVLLHGLSPLMRPAAWESEAQPARNAAMVIDGIMDRCAMDRYLLLIGRNHELYGMTKHSPYGPVFVAQRRIMGSSPEFSAKFIESEKATKLIVMKTEEDADFLQPSAWPIIRGNFTETAPACAGEVPDIAPYHLLFRKETAPAQ